MLEEVEPEGGRLVDLGVLTDVEDAGTVDATFDACFVLLRVATCVTEVEGGAGVRAAAAGRGVRPELSVSERMDVCMNVDLYTYHWTSTLQTHPASGDSQDL